MTSRGAAFRKFWEEEQARANAFAQRITEVFAQVLVENNVNTLVRSWSTFPPSHTESLLECLVFTIDTILFSPVEFELAHDSVSIFSAAPTFAVEAQKLDEVAQAYLRVFRRGGIDLFFGASVGGDGILNGMIPRLRQFRFNRFLEEYLRRDIILFNFIARALMVCLNATEPFQLYLNCLLTLRAATGLLLSRKDEQIRSLRHFAPGVETIRPRGLKLLFRLEEVLRAEDLYENLSQQRTHFLRTEQRYEEDVRTHAVKSINRDLAVQRQNVCLTPGEFFL